MALDQLITKVRENDESGFSRALADACERLQVVLRLTYHASRELLSGAEDCDDCDVIGQVEDRPCHRHGEASVPLYRAACAIEDAMGFCACGHTRAQHAEEDERGCRARRCECVSFDVPSLRAAR